MTNNFLYNNEERLGMLMFAATAFFVFIGALSRTIGTPLIWSVDVAQLTFAWTCVLGADIALKHNNHIIIDVVVRFLPRKLQSGLAILWLLCMLAFLGALIWLGIDLTQLNTERQLGDTPISYGWVTVTIPVGAALMSLTVIQRLWRISCGKEQAVIEGKDGDAI